MWVSMCLYNLMPICISLVLLDRVQLKLVLLRNIISVDSLAFEITGNDAKKRIFFSNETKNNKTDLHIVILLSNAISGKFPEMLVIS